MASSTRTRRDEDSFIADTPLAPIGGNQLQSFTGDVLSQQTGAIGKSVGGAFGMFEKLSDYHSTKMAEEQLDSIRERAEEEANAGMNDAPGSPRSWFLADGSIDKDKVNDFRTRYNEEYASVKPSFWRSESQMAWNKSYDDYVRNSDERLAGQALRGQAAAVRRVSKAALDNKLLKGDMKGYADELQNQVAANILTPTEAENMLLTQAKKNLTGGGGGGGGGSSVNIGGVNYQGSGAVLASLRAKRLKEEEASQKKPLKVGNTTVGDRSSSSLSSLDIGKPAEPAPSGKSPLSGDISLLPEEDSSLLFGQEPITRSDLTAGEKWAYEGDYGGVIDSLNPIEFGDFQSKLLDEEDGLRLVSTGGDALLDSFNPSDVHEWRSGRTADAFTERIAVISSHLGQMTKDMAEMYASHIAEQMFDRNPNPSVSSFKKALEASGIAEVLGDGNTDVGNATLEAIFNNTKISRDQQKVTGLKGLVDGIAEREAKYNCGYKSDRSMADWKRVELLKPNASTEVTLDADSDDETEKNDFQVVSDLYRRYGDSCGYKVPQDKKEFDKAVEDKGNSFLDAFRKRYCADARKDAIKDATVNLKLRMNTAIAEAVQKNNGQDLDYSALYHTAKDAVSTYLGNAVSDEFDSYFWTKIRQIEESKKVARVHDEQAAAAWKALADRESDLSELNTLQKNYEEFQKVEEKKSAERQKAAEKAEQEAQKRQSQIAAVERARNLATPRLRTVTWNGVTDEESAVNGVYSPYGFSVARVPKEMMDMIIAAGWEPDDDVVLHVDGQAGQPIYVDMNNISDSDEILMSHRAIVSAWGKKTGRGKNAKFQNGVFDSKALPVSISIVKYRNKTK